MSAPEALLHPHGAPVEPSQFRRLGPGLVTGAADDDPSGIATYSQAGAAYGFALLWTMLFSFPLMCAIQEISARIGRVTGRGIAGNIRRHYSSWVLYPVVFVLVAAGTLIPTLAGGHAYWGTIIAIFGTTISPYLFFWQASQETEEIRDHPAEQPLARRPWRRATSM